MRLVKDLLDEASLTNREVAFALSRVTPRGRLGHTTVSCYVNGHRSWPARYITVLHQLLTRRGVDIDLAQLRTMCATPRADIINELESRKEKTDG